MLVEFELNSLFDSDDSLQKWSIGWLTINLVEVGLNRFLQSWNHHRIPTKGIPIIKAGENNPLIPVDSNNVPDCITLAQEYRTLGGDINTRMNDLYPFNDEYANNLLFSRLNTLKERINVIYNEMLINNKIAVYSIYRDAYAIVSEVSSRNR
jgi:hypothetical protein